MYIIYFQDRKLVVCNKTHNIETDPEAVVYNNGIQHQNITQIPHFFDNTPFIKSLYIVTPDPEPTFKTIFTNLIHINAGGGVVINNQGKYLLIFRGGKWDLPKGKQEPNEDIRMSAIREVQEECGICNIEIQNHLCDTFHTFHRDNKFYLKKTRWYKMIYRGGCCCTKPQIEEDIEQAKWVDKESLHHYLKDTYPSILDVFAALKLT